MFEYTIIYFILLIIILLFNHGANMKRDKPSELNWKDRYKVADDIMKEKNTN